MSRNRTHSLFGCLQVQYSLLDQRPGQLMAPLCKERGVGLLCYGTVLGGLLSEKWIGKPTPSRADFKTVSEMKVGGWVGGCGGGVCAP